jgi:hypothetical protein
MRLRKWLRSKSGAEVARQNKQETSEGSGDGDPKAREERFEDFSSGTVDSDLGERQYSIFSDASTLIERNRPCDTEMLHGLVDFDFLTRKSGERLLPDASGAFSDPDIVSANERIIDSLSPETWSLIATFITPTDAANLALSSKTLRHKIGSEPWNALNRPENKQYKIEFLIAMDGRLPNHLFCFPCATFHLRTKIGQERLKADYVSNPLFNCPNVRHSVLPRMRLTHGYALPLAFVQLALRAHRYSPDHGIPWDSLSRHWKCRDSDWLHQTRFHIHNGHLLFRSVSKCIAPPDLPPSRQRLLLYSRNDYVPYFSVCAHWRDGELMNLCKCALSHIPKPREGFRQQLRAKPKFSLSARNPDFIVRLCNDCLYMRRCPQCPTEYLIEIKVAEDRKDRLNPFKHAIVVTRWSDLGDGSSPLSPEWAACNGEADYDSLNALGRRAISGVFESRVSNCVPGQRILTLNPKNERRGEAGDSWY